MTDISGDILNKIKLHDARSIALCEELKSLDPRLAAIAKTAYEQAGLWALKAATDDIT